MLVGGIGAEMILPPQSRDFGVIQQDLASALACSRPAPPLTPAAQPRKPELFVCGFLGEKSH